MAEKVGDAAESVRIAKWTAIVVGSLLLLLVGTAFVMTSVIDPNRYRSKIEGIVGDLSGRPLVIEGNLEITWFPWLGVRTGRAHLDDRLEVAGKRPILEWESVAVAAKVWPLLGGQVVVDRIRLQGPRIHLRRDVRGHGNWEDWGPAGTSRSATDEASVPGTPSQVGGANEPGEPSPAGGANAVQEPPSAGRRRPPQIAGIEIRDGTVDYVDEVSGLQVNLSGAELDVGEWLTGRPLPVHARFLVHTETLPRKGVWVQVDAAELAVRQEPLVIAAPKMSVKVADAQIDGGFTYEQTADAHVSARGSVAVHGSSLRKLASDLALDQTMPHDPTTLGPFELTSEWSYVDGSIAAKPLGVKLDGVNFTGWVERTAAPPAMWGFELHGDRIDLGRYVNVDSSNKKPFELPVAALRAINANGSLIFDQVVLADTHMADVRLRLQTPVGKP